MPVHALMKDQLDGLPPAVYPRATLVNSSLEVCLVGQDLHRTLVMLPVEVMDHKEIHHLNVMRVKPERVLAELRDRGARHQHGGSDPDFVAGEPGDAGQVGGRHAVLDAASRAVSFETADVSSTSPPSSSISYVYYRPYNVQ